MKRGFTLPELIVSLTVMSVILVIAAHFSSRQLGVLGAMSRAATVRGQIEETTATISALLANVRPSAGDLLLAQDSVIEFRLTTGSSAACSGAPGSVVVPAGSVGNPALAAYLDTPQSGDRMDALIADSSGATWLAFRVADVSASVHTCLGFPDIQETTLVTIAEPFTVPARAPLRFTRPFRVSHYRSSDGNWYLGGRDWNHADQRFNTVQPLSGPLRARSDAESGFRLRYRDVQGALLPDPVDVRQVAAISVVVRASSSTRGRQPSVDDSTVATVALRR